MTLRSIPNSKLLRKQNMSFIYYFSCNYAWLCSCRLHCCWQLKHLLRGYEHIVKQVNSTCSTKPWIVFLLQIASFFFCCVVSASSYWDQPDCSGFHIFCRVILPPLCSVHRAWHHSCTLCQPSGSPHSQAEKNIFHCLINIAWKMSLFVMWPLRVIWMRLIFHPGLQSSLFSQPLSYH